MSTHKDQLLGAYKVAISHIQNRIREQSEFLHQTAEALKAQAVRQAAPPAAQGPQALSSGLANSDSIQQVQELMAVDLDGLGEIVTARSKALAEELSKL